MKNRSTMRMPALGPLLERYRAFREKNRAAVKNLNGLSRDFTRIMTANTRPNEPFRTENVVHRCLKKRRLETITRDLGRRLQKTFRSVQAFVESYAALTRENGAPYEERERRIRASFLDQLWFLMKILAFNLCDDTTFLHHFRTTLSFLTEIKPEIASGVLTPGADLADRLTSFNEIARVLHQRGDDSFFRQVRSLHGVRSFSLGKENRLELLDLDGSEEGLVAGQPLSPEDIRNPALRALVIPYCLGQRGAGQEILNVAVVDGVLDTQFSLGLHKANLRAFIQEGARSSKDFIALSYYEPPHPVHSAEIGKRIRYFAGILEALDYAVHTDNISFLSAEFKRGASSTASTLTETMRAIISLKDLDEVPGLSDDPRRIVDLFRKGVTNLLGFSTVVRNFKYLLAGRLDRRNFAAFFKGDRLNTADLNVLFDDEFPAILKRMAKRHAINLPETMKFLRDLRRGIDERGN